MQQLVHGPDFQTGIRRQSSGARLFRPGNTKE